jgi:hypothetical protein
MATLDAHLRSIDSAIHAKEKHRDHQTDRKANSYARADVGGVVIVFECADVDEAKRYIADFPLTRAGLIEWQYIALDAPLPLEFLFDPTVDVAKPWDRTPRT